MKRMIDMFRPAGIWLLLFICLAGGAGAAGTAELRGERGVVDDAGRRIQVKRPFTRIISLYGAHTENLFALGLDAEIIGVSRHETYPPAALEKPVFSYRDDPEKFLAAAPDLVLIRPMIDRGYPRLSARLEQTGIAVVSLQPSTLEEMYGYWRILGKLAGREAQAEQMADAFQNAAAALNALSRGAPPKGVYFEAIHDKMKTFSPDAMPMAALEIAGGFNVAPDAAPVRGTNIAFFGKERLLSRGAEIDVYLAQSGAMNRPDRERILSEPGFRVIKAVREGNVHIIDEQIVARPTFRLLDGVCEIGAILYPDRFGARAAEIRRQALCALNGGKGARGLKTAPATKGGSHQ